MILLQKIHTKEYLQNKGIPAWITGLISSTDRIYGHDPFLYEMVFKSGNNPITEKGDAIFREDMEFAKKELAEKLGAENVKFFEIEEVDDDYDEEEDVYYDDDDDDDHYDEVDSDDDDDEEVEAVEEVEDLF